MGSELDYKHPHSKAVSLATCKAPAVLWPLLFYHSLQGSTALKARGKDESFG